MQFLSTFRKLDHLHYLIRTRSTGKPEALAEKLGLCPRQVFRLIADLKEIGFPIQYNQVRECYEYDEEVALKIELIVGRKNVLQIQ